MGDQSLTALLFFLLVIKKDWTLKDGQFYLRKNVSKQTKSTNIFLEDKQKPTDSKIKDYHE